MAAGPHLLVLHPHQLADAQTLIQVVKRNQTVVLNASSANDGQAHPIDADSFLFTPAQARGWSSGRQRPEAFASSSA